MTEPGLAEVVADLRRTGGKEACLRAAYGILAAKYHGGRLQTALRFWEIFYGLDRLWAKRGFMYCTNLNRLLRFLLLSSGLFQPEDIRERWTLLWFVSPHQYLSVRLEDGRWIDVDSWEETFGVRLGKHT